MSDHFKIELRSNIKFNKDPLQGGGEGEGTSRHRAAVQAQSFSLILYWPFDISG